MQFGYFNVKNNVKRQLDDIRKEGHDAHSLAGVRYKVPKRSSYKKISGPNTTTQAILSYLAKNQGRRIGSVELGEAVGLHNSGVARHVKWLIGNGYLTQRGKVNPRYYVKRRRIDGFHIENGSYVKKSPSAVPKLSKKKSDYLTTREATVLDYISKHQGVELNQADIANALGLANQSNISRVTKSLEEKGRITRQLGLNNIYTYKLVNATEPKVKEAPQEAPKVSKTPSANEQNLHQLLQSMIIEFLVETKKTDVASFDEWVKNKLN